MGGIAMMKKLILSTILCGLACSANYALAVDCATPPTCEELGYTDNVGLCPNKYIACPFDTTKGTCILDATVGQIAYFTTAPRTPGWLICGGGQHSKDTYPELYNVLGINFCRTDHGGGCKSGYFRVPDYQGYFLRVMGTPSSTYGGSGNTSVYKPQAEQLPNIEGKATNVFKENGPTMFASALSFGTMSKRTAPTSASASTVGWASLNFNASDYSSIYKDNGHVIPANYAVYAYIYAGRYGEATGYKACEPGDGVYTSNGKCYAIPDDQNRTEIYVGGGYYANINGKTTISTASSFVNGYGSNLLSDDDIKNNAPLIRSIYYYGKGGTCVIVTQESIGILKNATEIEFKSKSENTYAEIDGYGYTNGIYVYKWPLPK